jgi:RNA polymerase sigma-70 factor (ECF subfamily)
LKAKNLAKGVRMRDRPRAVRGLANEPTAQPETAEALLARVARGDEAAFGRLYDQLSGPIFGLVLRILRNPAQSEEVAQEVLVELWRTATRFDPSRGTVHAWAMTMAHRRAVDRVRSAQASSERETRAATAEVARPFDEVSEQVSTKMEREQVRRCLGTLTELQRQSVELAYYRGYTYREVADLLQAPLGTVKTRLRDGLIRLRDCLGVAR